MRLRDRLDLVLHPVRLRLMLALVGGERTVADLAAALPDVSRATLYRHLNLLVKGGLVRVTAQRAVRGAVERTYALAQDTLNLDRAALQTLSREEHLELFTTYLSSLLNDYVRYLGKRPQPDLQADGVGYHKHVLFLSDEELAEFASALNRALLPYLQNPPQPGRKARLFATVLMPFDDGE
jgi:DNA-binding transcriptional ArsR family regulator